MLLTTMTENASSLITSISSSSRGSGYDTNAGSTENENSAVWVDEAGTSFNDYLDSKEESDFKAYYARYSWPLRNITVPHNHDVLFGRGGGTNNHPGNKRYRQLVEERKSRYLSASRNEKPLIALEIVKFLREQQSPPGRFLQLNEMTKKWDDVGYKRAREKTSQALREKLNYAHNNTLISKVDDQGVCMVEQTSPTVEKTVQLLHQHSVGAQQDSSGHQNMLDGVSPPQIEPLKPPQSWNSDANSIITIPVGEDVRSATLQPPQPNLPMILPCLKEQDILNEDENGIHCFPLEVPKLSPPKKQPIYREHSLTGYPLNDDDDELLPGNLLVSTFAPERLIKRATSHNAEKDPSVKKNLKMPRHTKRAIERQHSLAGVYLPGARIDAPAEMFSSNDDIDKDDLPLAELSSTTNSDALPMAVTSFPNGSRKQLLEMMKLPRSNDLSRHPEHLLLLPSSTDLPSSVFPSKTLETTPCCEEAISRQLSELLAHGCCVSKNTHSSNYDPKNVVAKQEDT